MEGGGGGGVGSEAKDQEKIPFSRCGEDVAWVLQTETPAARRESEFPGNARKALSNMEYVEKQRGGEGEGGGMAAEMHEY